jgi:methionyl-tRNA formyltransferase
MNIILLTQDDPFYLAETTDDFITKIKRQGNHQIIQAIVSSPSPYGKKESFLKKVSKTYSIFGFQFFFHYSLRFICRKLILRKSVIEIILKHNIPLWKLENSINKAENVARLKQLNADIIIIIAGNQIIKKQVLDIPKYGVINAHSSLLPNYKGLMPTFWVLKNNEKITGVSVFKLTEGIDDGPIIIQREIAIDKSTTQSELVQKSKYLANELLINSLDILDKSDLFIENKGGSYYKSPSKPDVKEFYKQRRQFF